jgi:uncharacterized damage-inducible protein DinB
MDVRDLLELSAHMAWADATIWTSALRAPDASGDERLRAVFHHVHLVQHLFVDGWEGRPPSVRQAAEFVDATSLASWGRDAHRRIDAFLTRAPPPDLTREFREPWTEHFEARVQRKAAPHTLGESILQVFLHSIHHRGQICRRLREVKVEPPTIDFIVWLWAGRPAPAWPALDGQLDAAAGR